MRSRASPLLTRTLAFLKGETLTNFLDTKFDFKPTVMDVLVPGAYTTVQDYPARIGQGHGIPRSGPMDDVSARSKTAPDSPRGWFFPVVMRADGRPWQQSPT